MIDIEAVPAGKYGTELTKIGDVIDWTKIGDVIDWDENRGRN